MDIYGLLQIIIMGLCLGVLTGIMPGFGILAAILLSFSWLKNFDAFSIMVFYMSVVSSSQYVGSIVAIYLGVPGEQTSLIAARYGFRINQHNSSAGQILLATTAISSLIGALIAVTIIGLSFLWISSLAVFFSVRIQILMILIIVFFIIFYNRAQGILFNFSLVLMGLFLGSLGFNQIQDLSLSFNQDWLLPGLNPGIIIFILFVIPNLLQYSNHKKMTVVLDGTARLLKGIGATVKYMGSIIRGALSGSVMGLFPGIGTSACSQLAASLEQKIKKGFIPKIVAAETANNSAVLTSMIPMLLFGLPILPSEAIIVDLISSKLPLVGEAWLLNSAWNGWNKLEIFLLLAVVCNFVMFAFSWWGAKYLAVLYSLLSPKTIMIIIIMIMTIFLSIDSWQHVRWKLDLITVAFLFPFLYLIVRHKIDTLPLIFSFMMTDLVQKVFVVMVKLYF